MRYAYQRKVDRSSRIVVISR